MKIVLTLYSGPRRFFDMYIPDPGIAQLCGSLVEYGVKPIIFDLNLPENSFAKFLSLIRTQKPDIIGFKFFDTGFRGILHLAEIIRKEIPSCCLVAAGPHVTLFREHIFHKTSIFDFIVIGEGEKTIIELIEYLLGKRPRTEIANVMFIFKENIIQNDIRLTNDLDDLALPNWHLLNFEMYFPLILLNDHRGCYQTCAFCAHNFLWGYSKSEIKENQTYKPLIRTKSFSRLCYETEHVIQKYGIRLLGFTDSSPIPNRLIKWADFLIKTEKNVFWTSFANVNQFSSDDFRLFNKSGCKSLWIGVETGDEDLLKIMGKYFTREDVIRTFSDLRKLDIVGVPGFIIGFPGETVNSVGKTLSLINKIKPKMFVLSPFILDPGTPVALNPTYYRVSLCDDWECKIVLRDELNEFEIPYYSVNGIHNNQIWSELEKITPYKGWDADRTIAESEYAAVLAAALDIPVHQFLKRVTEALASHDYNKINKVIRDVWKATS
jgi:anaerobic magnesium-protoporphyrin IX monomethyl ester cyclase